MEPQLKLQKLINQENYKVITFVRHPFDRLISAYRDKIEGPNYSALYYEMLAKSIQIEYGYLNFNNFLLHILSTNQNPDPHWIPYYKMCPYCDGTITFIGRLEKFNRDMR